MKLDTLFVRRFDEDLFWRLYQKGNGGGIFRNIYKALYMRMASRNAGYIGRETVLKGPIKLQHGFNGIHISRYAVIGKNCSIFQNVTIGNRNSDAPIIGDNCIIGANAVVLGNIKIGDNVKIGAGAIVVEDIPSGAVVVGPKARVLIKEPKI